jgi:hypothetical protein
MDLYCCYIDPRPLISVIEGGLSSVDDIIENYGKSALIEFGIEKQCFKFM